MKHLVIISTLFVIGSPIGWVIKLFFRRFVSQKKWMNPGFLTGPYLPIYGFGVVVLYGVSNIPLGIDNQVWDVIVRILIIGVGMTLIELLAGLIFIKGFKIKLWDYLLHRKRMEAAAKALGTKPEIHARERQGKPKSRSACWIRQSRPLALRATSN